MFDTLHLWSSKILTMVCDFISYFVTIFPDVEMLHNNILGFIEEMQSTMDIKDEKEQHNAFEKAWDSNCNAFG
jgi:hypothetical protein